VKVETTVTFNVTFDEEINEAYENNSFETNLELLKKYDEQTKQLLEEDYLAENVVVRSVFVQD
jgi:hypothetical protein